MFTMRFDITVGDWRLGMVEKVEVRRSVEQLSDTAVITLPGAEYNVALDVEQKIHRGDRVVINLGYEEVGMVQEFEGWLQRIGTDNGAIILECEDDLFRFRKSIPDAQLKNVSLSSLLDLVIAGVGGGFKVDCSYSWTYEKFVINSATGFDVRRLNMLLAVLERRAGFKLSAKDVFLNMAGGLRVSDPACDLAVICAVLSSNFDFAIPADVCFAGEVGLSGEIRPVGQTDRRIAEAARLGFRKIFVSSFSSFDAKSSEGIQVVKVADVPALVKSLFK